MIVLSQTIQAMQNTETILRDLTRVAKQAMLPSPTLATGATACKLHWAGICPCPSGCRISGTTRPISIGARCKTLTSCAPKTKSACRERTVMTGNQRVEILPNLLGSLAFYRVG